MTEGIKSIPQSNEPVYSVFGVHEKRFIVFAAAFAGLSSSLSANMDFPALNTLANELIDLTITCYILSQGLAPTPYGDMADMVGRRLAYIVGS